MPIVSSPPLPVASATASIANQINYRLSRPFVAPLFLAVINISLNTSASALPLVGTITPGTITRAGFANLQVNQATFDDLLALVGHSNLNVTMSWDSVSLAPADIICSSGVVAVFPSP